MHGSGQGHGRWRRRRRNPGNAVIWAGAWKMDEEECMDLGRGMEDGGGGGEIQGMQ